MTALRLVSLLVFAFGTVAFIALLVQWLREPARKRDRVYGWVFLACGIWFVWNLGVTAAALPRTPLLAFAFLFPPLMMGLHLHHSARVLQRPVWRRMVQTVTALAVLAFGWGLTDFAPRGLLEVLLAGSFGLAALFSAAIVFETRRADSDARWWGASLMIAAAAFLVPIGLLVGGAPLNLALRSLPLAFLLAGTWYQRRFYFYDILVKRGLFVFLCFAALSILAVFLSSSLWANVLILLPAMLLAPQMYRGIAALVDRYLLGRRFSPAQAGPYFLEGLREAATETELAAIAEARLRVIFGPLEASPVLSEDIALRRSLDGLYASLLENIRLQQRRNEQELAASRAELKALRAQVNPHFLFNALNSIAALIHSNPALAEETVEKLAEVFRYTLERSETEWVTLAEELEFIRAYLDVEEARFAERLRTSIQVAPQLQTRQVPTMLVQILVENAIKHGTSQARGVGRVDIEITESGGCFRIEVRDNGPGLGTSVNGGYGLRNVAARLERYYGSRARFGLERLEKDGQTLAWVELPL
jgi:two-component sensor histidine kinase